VECVRNLAEFLCFSEQQGLDYFQEFICNDVLTLDLPRILQFNNRLVSIQIIQTVSILVQNIG
jgi:hypothetical protein